MRGVEWAAGLLEGEGCFGFDRQGGEFSLASIENNSGRRRYCGDQCRRAIDARNARNLRARREGREPSQPRGPIRKYREGEYVA